MEQKMLVYSFVAQGTVILAETDMLPGNMATIAAQHLQNMPPTQSMFSYSEQGYSFNFLARDGFVYSVVAAESTGREVPFGFLERIQNDFRQRYDRGRVIAAASINREYGPKLKEEMEYCSAHPEEISNLAKVKARLHDLQGVMVETIDKILDRNDNNLTPLVDKTDLRSQAQYFREQALRRRKKKWFCFWKA